MGMYEYNKGVSDLQQGHANDEATNAYARFISQQRYSRQRDDQNRGFQRSFPQFTGQYANRLGSHVRSGVFGDKMNQYVGDYTRQQGQTDADEGAFKSNDEQNTALRNSQFQQNLQLLMEQYGQQRAMADPFASQGAPGMGGR